MNKFVKEIDGEKTTFKIVPEKAVGICTGCIGDGNFKVCSSLNTHVDCTELGVIFEVDSSSPKNELTPEIISTVLDLYIRKDVHGWIEDGSEDRRKKICEQIMTLYYKDNDPEYIEFLRLKEKFKE
jgi:hypothetical protein